MISTELMGKYEGSDSHFGFDGSGCPLGHRTEDMTLNVPGIEHYLCDKDEIDRRIEQIDPREYEKTRNHLNGAVT